MNFRSFSIRSLSLALFLALAACHVRGDEPGRTAEQRIPGLIGLAHKNGAPTRIAYHYPHGKVFPADLIRSRFHDGEAAFPPVEIALVGYVEVPQEMCVDVYHAAGGVNRDHGTLFLDGRRIGQVGDDTAKSVVYTLTMPQGTHEIRWVLTGGTFQTNLLKFQAAKTGDLLSVYHTAKQRRQTGAAKAATTIDAQGTVEGWPPVDPKAWLRVSMEERIPGLIGLAHKNGAPTQIAYHYPHGKVFPAELIRSRFHDGEAEFPSVEIALVGYVEVPQEMSVDVYHAAGGVNGDHGTLFLDGRRIGQVGDDTVKNVIYRLELPKGPHEIRWTLTGGKFQPNLLKFQAAQTGGVLNVYHTARQRHQTGAAKAAKTIDAQGDVEPLPPGGHPWTRVSTDRQ